MSEHTQVGNLSQIMAVRHGDYSRTTRDLDAVGIGQVERLAGILRSKVKPEHKVEVLSSPLSRAKQSAEIIARQFGVKIETCDELELDEFEDGEEQMNAVLRKLNGADVVIVVTHHRAPSGIINACSRKFFQKEVGSKASEKGDGLMISLETGTVATSLLT